VLKSGGYVWGSASHIVVPHFPELISDLVYTYFGRPYTVTANKHS